MKLLILLIDFSNIILTDDIPISLKSVSVNKMYIILVSVKYVQCSIELSNIAYSSSNVCSILAYSSSCYCAYPTHMHLLGSDEPSGAY